MIDLNELEDKIKKALPDCKINVSKKDEATIHISIRWDYAGFYEGTSMYLENEFIFLDKKTLQVNNISNPRRTNVKKALEIFNYLKTQTQCG